MKIQKKVPIKVGFTDKSRNANAEKAKAKWESKGWTVANRIDGGMTKTSYLELEKDKQETVKTTKTNKKLTLKNIGITFAVLVVLGAIFGEDDEINNTQPSQNTSMAKEKQTTGVNNNTAHSEAKQPKKRKEFTFTYQQFIEKFNQSLRTLSPNTNLKITNTVISKDGGSVTAFLSKNTGFSLWINPETKKLQGIMFISTEAQKVTEMVFGAVATIMALENPNMAKEERTAILKQTGLVDKLKMDGDKIIFSRNGVKYSILMSSATGVMMAVDP